MCAIEKVDSKESGIRNHNFRHVYLWKFGQENVNAGRIVEII